jgi:signal transduction histidine kinase
MREAANGKLEQIREHYQASDFAAMAAVAEAGIASLEATEADASLLGSFWYWWAVSQELLGDPDAALERYRRALALQEEAGNRREVAATLNSLANLHGLRGEQTQRLEALLRARKIFLELGELRGRAAVANSLGNYYGEMEQLEEALPFFEESVTLRREMDSPAYLAAGLLGLGISHRELGRPEEAEATWREALAIYRELEDPGGLADILTNLGNLARIAGDYDQALQAYQEALGYDESTGYRYGQTILKHNLALTYQLMGDLETAATWADRAVDAAEDLKNPERLENAYQVRSVVREALGDFAGALADTRRRGELKAQRDQAAREDALLALQTRFETAEKEREIEQLERAAVEQELALTREESARVAAEQAQEIAAARGRTLTVLVGAAVLAALILAAMFRQSRRAQRRLAQQQREIEQALAGLREAHAELKRLYDRKSEFLGFAAHDLRSPLFAIDAVCGEVAAGLLDSPQAGVGEIRQAATKMREELDAWLDAERREQTEITIHPVNTDIAKLCAEVVALNYPAARAKQIELEHATSESVAASADPWRWREVVDNLVSNAIKFTPAKGRVRVETRSVAGRAEVRVSDTGPGLSDEDRAQLFGAFAQLSAQPTAGEVSTGLGLHLVKRIVDAHGAEIAVENAPEAGAIFIVSIPLDSRG